MSAAAALTSFVASPVGRVVLFLAEPDKKTPEDEDVVAGWLGFGVLIALILAVAFLCFSFLKQLRRADRARDAGVFGDVPEPGDDGPPEGSDEPVDEGPGESAPDRPESGGGLGRAGGDTSERP